MAGPKPDGARLRLCRPGLTDQFTANIETGQRTARLGRGANPGYTGTTTPDRAVDAGPP